MKIEKCYGCGENEFLVIDENSILCINCGLLYELSWKACDKLSFWLYKKQYMKGHKEELENG